MIDRQIDLLDRYRAIERGGERITAEIVEAFSAILDRKVSRHERVLDLIDEANRKAAR